MKPSSPPVSIWFCVWFALHLAILNAQAHDPFGCSSRMMVQEDQIELSITMGSDGTRQLLAAASYNGSFNSLILPPLPAGLGWNTNVLNTSGTLSVVVIAKPFIGSAGISGNGFQFTGTGGVASGNYYLLGATNLGTPLGNWLRLRTKQFDNNGNFNFTNALNPNWLQSFYLLQLP